MTTPPSTASSYAGGRPRLIDAKPSIGVVSIATNRYVEHWRRMALSADRHLFPGHDVVLHVFTDRVADVTSIAPELERVTVNPIGIDALTWPEATLLRYEVITEHQDQLPQDVLMHLDADMLVAADVGVELTPSAWAGGLALVRHPGYRRPSGLPRARLYSSRPGVAVRDAYSGLRFGGIGRWETDRASTAFVPRGRRATYVCGGTWFGLRQPFLRMADELASRTRADLTRGHVAVWHDESHLNWFAARNSTELLDSSYCYADGFPGVAGLRPLIIAVDKSDDRTR